LLYVHDFNTSSCFHIGFVQVCADRLGHDAKQWTNEKALDWAKAGFPVPAAPVLKGNILMHQWYDLHR
jgi:hypothetical protein